MSRLKMFLPAMFAPKKNLLCLPVLLSSFFLLSACEEKSEQSPWIPTVYRDAGYYANQCSSPRTGINPRTGNSYPDKQGSYVTENQWLRSMSDDLYLWYDEIIDRDVTYYSTFDYFDLLRTEAITASGAAKDRFHFALNTEEWLALSQGEPVAGYGMQLAILSQFPPREVVAVYVEPGSPAETSGVTRGARFVSVNGISIDTEVSSEINTLNAGLFAEEADQTYNFEVLDLGSDTPRAITMTTESVTPSPVQSVNVINDGGDNIGYFLFNDHIATAEGGLIDAIDQLATAGVTDLVLDVRYNGGGFLDIAAQLAYMIAGPGPTAGMGFDIPRFNDKHPSINPVTGEPIEATPFHSEVIDIGDDPALTEGDALPTLNLNRVFVITSGDTCSASEAIINGLRGVDVEVYQIGTRTCGKPYGFYGLSNCRNTYFTIQFEGSNAKGFSNYGDGFRPQDTANNRGEPLPGCEIADDFDHLLGDVAEARLAAALNYRTTLDATGTGECPVAVTATNSAFGSGGISRDLSEKQQPILVKSPALKAKIMR